MNRVNRPDGGNGRWTGPNGEPIRPPRLLERLSDFATMSELGWSPARIAFELGVSERTVERYQARARRGEVMGFTPAEALFWSIRDPDKSKRSYSRNAWLLCQRDMGAALVGPDGLAVRYRPRSWNDPRPWLRDGADPGDRAARFHGKQCRVAERD